jgi:hypothetical protein
MELCDSELVWNTITKRLDENDRLKSAGAYAPSSALAFGEHIH